MEALPRRRHGPDVAPRHPADAGSARAPRRGDVRRRPDRLPLRPRGRRQRLLLPAGQHRPAPPLRPRRLLRPARLDRRLPHRLPVRRRHLADRRPEPGRRAAQAGGAPGRATGRAAHPPGPRRLARHLARGGLHRPGQRGRRPREPVLAHPPRRPRPHHPRHPRRPGPAARNARLHRPDRVHHRRRGRRRHRDRQSAPRQRPLGSRAGWPPGSCNWSRRWSPRRTANGWRWPRTTAGCCW